MVEIRRLGDDVLVFLITGFEFFESSLLTLDEVDVNVVNFLRALLFDDFLLTEDLSFFAKDLDLEDSFP
jgi:hypothetical protein